MSIQYCFNCDNYIDTDFDAEHFDECGKDDDGCNEDSDPMENLDENTHLESCASSTYGDIS